jgi:hypothetical protein
MTFIPEQVELYKYWISEREGIRVCKEFYNDKPPWTEDEILRKFKFCQVFREDDRTTRWLRTHIREPLKDTPEVFMATVIFRWFNLIETGRTLIDNNLHIDWDREKAIELVTKQPKWITGSYIIKTPNRMDKVTGVAECITHMWNAKDYILEQLYKFKEEDGGSLEKAWELIKEYPYMGPFMAYEVVTDLRFTHFLNEATDICSWANAGPGAMRGLNRLTGRDLTFCKRSHDWNSEMQELYELVKVNNHNWWVLNKGMYDLKHNFEMREIEGGLCEFDKYSRILNEEGRTRSIYKFNKNLPLVEDIEEGESIWAK